MTDRLTDVMSHRCCQYYSRRWCNRQMPCWSRKHASRVLATRFPHPPSIHSTPVRSIHLPGLCKRTPTAVQNPQIVEGSLLSTYNCVWSVVSGQCFYCVLAKLHSSFLGLFRHRGKANVRPLEATTNRAQWLYEWDWLVACCSICNTLVVFCPNADLYSDQKYSLATL